MNKHTAQSVIEVLKSYNNISLQDLGRPKGQHLAVSVSGAADEFSFLAANQLLSNDCNQLALEITLGCVTFSFLSSCVFVLTGADCLAKLNDNTIICGQVTVANKGDVLTLNRPESGVYSYLAIHGGFVTSTWLESGIARPDQRAQPLKYLKGYAVSDNKGTEVKDAQHLASRLHKNRGDVGSFTHRIPRVQDTLTLRFIANHHWQKLNQAEQKILLDHTYEVDVNSNKMGYRLNSPKAQSKIYQSLSDSCPNLSTPVTFGTIQMPFDKQLIILMKDRQTIGGYPSFGTVMKTDLFRLSQLRNGQKVNFIPISLEKAQQQLSAFYKRYRAN